MKIGHLGQKLKRSPNQTFIYKKKIVTLWKKLVSDSVTLVNAMTDTKDIFENISKNFMRCWLCEKAEFLSE